MSLKLTKLIIEYEHKIIIPIQNLHATDVEQKFSIFMQFFLMIDYQTSAKKFLKKRRKSIKLIRTECALQQGT